MNDIFKEISEIKQDLRTGLTYQVRKMSMYDVFENFLKDIDNKLEENNDIDSDIKNSFQSFSFSSNRDNKPNDNVNDIDLLNDTFQYGFDSISKDIQDLNSDNRFYFNEISNYLDEYYSIQEETNEVFKDILSQIEYDLSDEKIETSVINIASALELGNIRNEQINDTLQEFLYVDRNNKDMEEKTQKSLFDNVGALTTLATGLGSLLGVGGLGLAIPSLIKAIGSIKDFALKLPSIAKSALSKIVAFSKSAIETLKGIGSKALKVGKDVIGTGSKIGSKVASAGSKILKPIGQIGSKVGKAGSKAISKIGSVGSKIASKTPNALKFGGKVVGASAGIATTLYDIGTGFADTEKITGKEDQEFGTLDILEAGAINAATLGGLLNDPSEYKKNVSSIFDSLLGVKPNIDKEQSYDESVKEANENISKRGNTDMLGKPIQDMSKKTSNFGWRVHPVKGTKKFHYGTDFGVPSGTPLYAPFDGKIAKVYESVGGGKTIEIQHQGGLYTRYLHLSNIGVNKNDIVKTGQQIGSTGNTGKWTTGAHLHWEGYIKGKPVDPTTLKYNYSAPTEIMDSSKPVGGMEFDYNNRIYDTPRPDINKVESNMFSIPPEIKNTDTFLLDSQIIPEYKKTIAESQNNQPHSTLNQMNTDTSFIENVKKVYDTIKDVQGLMKITKDIDNLVSNKSIKSQSTRSETIAVNPPEDINPMQNYSNNMSSNEIKTQSIGAVALPVPQQNQNQSNIGVGMDIYDFKTSIVLSGLING